MEASKFAHLELDVKVDFIEMINYSLAHNDFSLINNIYIINESEDIELTNAKLKIYSNSGFIYEFERDIEVIDIENDVLIQKPSISYNYDYFREITERIKTHFFIEIVDENNETLYKKPYRINILPYQHWLGTKIYPELTCTYIVPNDNEIRRIVAEAGVKLKEWTGDPSFVGYQAGESEKVRLQAAAIYAALQKDNIAYKNPPASFERFGQNIRYPQEIIQYKNGTCLDLAFLYAACLEAIGLHPLVVFIKDHAFVGFWLLDKNFTEPYISDYATISKRLSQDIKDIEVIETTSLVNGNDASFEDAIIIAHQNLVSPYNFEGVVDVTSGRQYGITPIMTKSDQSDYIMEGYGDRKTVTEAPNTVIERLGNVEFKLDSIEKTDIWSRNLLDLTLRNSMINFRMNKSAIQLMVYDLASLEDELSSYERFKVIEKPEILTLEEANNSVINSKALKSRFKNMIDADFKENRIRSFLTEYMLEKQLKSLYRKAKSNLDENGANSLFIAIGFLKWCEPETTNKFYRAPLLLLPLSIEKKSASSKFQIELSDDEPQLNVTLVEYLRQKFNIDLRHLINLPKDDRGIDIPLLFSSIRKTIMDKAGWDIEEIAAISNFSFSKFVMWNDLQARKEEISSNSNVQALIKGNYKIDRNLEEINARNIEKTDKPHELSTGSLVDASQLEAIKASDQSSFVLHGPPGTGKSQTITNMIIHNINKGKKVLFVAEKRAALNVVNDRLTKLGLEDFILELHSNKTKKSVFLDKVEKSLAHNLEPQNLDIDNKSNELYKLKNELSDYVEALHKKGLSGYSLYELIQLHEKYHSIPSNINLKSNIVKTFKNSDLVKVNDITTILDNTVNQLKYSKNNHPLSDFKVTKYSISKRDKFPEIIMQLQSSISQLQILIKKHAKINDLQTIKHIQNFENEINKLEEYKFSEPLSDNMYSLYKKVTLESAYNYASAVLTTYRDTSNKLLNKYKEKVLDINTQYLNSEYADLNKKMFKSKKIKKLIDNLAIELLQPRELEEKEFVDDLQLISEFQKAREALQKRNEDFINSFGNSWKGRNTDLVILGQQIQFIEDINLHNKNEEEKNIIKNLMNLVIEDPNEFNLFKENLALLRSSSNSLINDYNLDEQFLKDLQLEKLRTKMEKWKTSMADFKNWTFINEQFDELEKILKINVRKKFFDEENSYKLKMIVWKDIIENLIRINFSEYEVLDSFNGFEIEQKIQLLKEKEREFNEISINNTVNKATQNIKEKRNNEDFESEFLLLQKAIRSNARGQSIRTIFNKTSNVIQDLFPVMLMSPLSTAQYIDPDFPKYDLVIFDEASQIPTDIAIGAISRAENCIVVGDPKQMPPTTFFGANNMDEDNLEMEDLESLLDDCLAANFPEKYLQWHYRSTHESLIHYSNRTYYNNSLQTYPSSNALNSKVSFKNVEGIYKRGTQRNNEIEAKAVVEIIIRHLKRDSKDSIGVITFNIQQQNTIEDLFNNELTKYPLLDSKNTSSKEPVFIKNLENVQGDERDIILFSTTFGPDEEGKMTMNFGPLNNSGGWRRLNVAITRARKEMKIITSFNPEHIDVKRTKAEGVIGLKGFVEYARNAGSLPSINSSVSDDKNGIATILKEELYNRGINVKVHLGNSKFKIDLAIIDPDNNDKYKLAILIDGQNYYQAQTANDRNIIQPSVLEGLGWNIHRIWTIDWYEGKNKEIEKVLSKIESIDNEI